MRKLSSISFYILIIIGLLSSCDKSIPDIPASIQIITEKLSAKTTDTLEFIVETYPEFDQRSTFFYNWDWEGDSVYDTRFTSLSTVKHRFLKPGNYTVTLQCNNGKGKSIITSLRIAIEQGFSKPHPVLKVNPAIGNYTKVFSFDASETFDYEDSLSVLQFRWDLHGDGYFEYPYDTIKTILHRYDQPGIYHPSIEVRDPSGMVSSKTTELIVHRKDSLINVQVDWSNDGIAKGDQILFDASSSSYLSDPERDYQVSWYLPYSLVWTDPSYSKTLIYEIPVEGELKFKCKIIVDKTLLENEEEFSIFASSENLPPEPNFEVSINYGNIETQFYFSCWNSSDDHTTPSRLQLRWDWDNDGSWDTPFSTEKEYYHQYTEPGQYGVVLEAKDEGALVSRTYGTINVSPYTNPTDIVKDVRDENIYGTVQIGRQWWMAENLRFEVPQKTESGLKTTICLFESESWCESVGLLYHVSSISHVRYDDKYIQVCPTGWSIPTKEDWEELISTIGGSSQVSELMLGGKTDFNGLYLGLADYSIIGNPFPTDTIYTFEETFQAMYYSTSTIPDDINNARTDIFTIKIPKSGAFWWGYNSARYYMPVRCIKEELFSISQFQ